MLHGMNLALMAENFAADLSSTVTADVPGKPDSPPTKAEADETRLPPLFFGANNNVINTKSVHAKEARATVAVIV